MMNDLGVIKFMVDLRKFVLEYKNDSFSGEHKEEEMGLYTTIAGLAISGDINFIDDPKYRETVHEIWNYLSTIVMETEEGDQ